MTRRVVWLGLLVVALLVIGGVWFFNNFERAPVKHRTEEQAEARRNPYLALERFMARMNRPLTRQNNAQALDALPAGATLILDRQRRQHMPPARVERLLAWVAAGGYLIVVPEAAQVEDPLLEALDPEADNAACAPGDEEDSVDAGEAGESDESADSDESDESDQEVQTELPLPKPARPPRFPEHTAVAIPGVPRPLTIQFLAPGLSSNRSPEWTAGSAEHGDQILHYRHGEGQVTVVLGLDRLLRNAEIGKFDHAELLWTLLDTYQPDATRPVMMAARLEVPDLWDWLVSNAGAALISSLTLLGLWLWRIVPRFGPPLPEPAPDRRELREHLAALGRYVWRAGGLAHWLNTARQAFLNRLALRHPALAALPPAEQAAALSRLTLRPVALITAALHEPAASPASFTLAMRTLRNLERTLERTL